jgi:hypothetical protein
MTFLPFFLNFLRLKLNGSERIWSQGTDSYTEIEVGYVPSIKNTKEQNTTRSLSTLMTVDAKEKMRKL